MVIRRPRNWEIHPAKPPPEIAPCEIKSGQLRLHNVHRREDGCGDMDNKDAEEDGHRNAKPMLV
jgi:hypothetical protein